jgi:hypothetical protein
MTIINKIINHFNNIKRVLIIKLDLFIFSFYSIFLKNLLSKKIILIYNNNLAPQTFGDFLHFCFLVRFFKKKNILAKAILIKKKKINEEKIINKFNKNFRVQQIKILKKIGCLDRKEVIICKGINKQILRDTINFHLIFKKKIISNKKTYDKHFNLLTKLLKNEKKVFFEKFFLDKREFNSIKFKKKYISWNFRYNPNWSEQYNFNEYEFLKIYKYIKKRFKNYSIMIISDIAGCNKAKQISKKNNLNLLFSKNYSKDFLGDVELILKSKFYLQFRGGGMLIIPIFTKLPYLIISYMSYFNVPFSKKKYISWQSSKQKRILNNNFSFFEKN